MHMHMAISSFTVTAVKLQNRNLSSNVIVPVYILAKKSWVSQTRMELFLQKLRQVLISPSLKEIKTIIFALTKNLENTIQSLDIR